MNPLSGLRLQHLPLPFKLLLTAALMTLGVGYLFALTNVVIKVGFTQERVAGKYYGTEASRQALQEIERGVPSGESGIVEEESFSFDDLEEDPTVSSEVITSIPSFEALVSEGHFHLFGYTTIFFVAGFIIAMAELRMWLKNTLILAPFIASVLDIWSMLLTRFAGPGFAWLLIISGMVMSLSFLLIFVIGLYQIWFLKEHKTD